MANYPYSSGLTGLIQAFSQLRKGFPSKVDAGYLQRFNIAPANESYIISILRFLGLIDEDGSPVEGKIDYFFGNDDSFKSGLESTLREAYSQVFSEMGNGALDASKEDLTHWFRASDKTSALVGGRQASTFQTLAALAGHGDLPAVRPVAVKKATTAAPGSAAKKTSTKKDAPKRDAPKKEMEKSVEDDRASGVEAAGKNKVGQEVGLTVRIEVNLPPGGDAETYDAIFASIKKHLMS